MDATFRPLHFSQDMFAYAESKRIFEIFKNMLEHLVLDRPEEPVNYLCDLLLKSGVYDVPQVIVIGPPTLDRTLICTALETRMPLVRLTRQDLLEDMESDDMVLPSTWADRLKQRTRNPDCNRQGWLLEGMPRDRLEAHALRGGGIFPTHVVVVEIDRQELENLADDPAEDATELKEYLMQKALLLDFYEKQHVRRFYAGEDVEGCIEKVVDFIRSKQQPQLPYLPRVLLLGPYGSGRRTMAARLCEKYHLIKVDYMEELRKVAMRETPLKQKLQEILRTPEPVPDDMLVQVASSRLLEKDCVEAGWILFNFPDTLQQAKLLAKALEGFQINRAIFLDAPLQACLDRVEPRRLDTTTGQVYHLKKNPSEARLSVGRLVQLPQDSADSVIADYKVYQRNVQELKEFFRTGLAEDIVCEVDVTRKEEEVFEVAQASILYSAKMKLPTS